MAEIYKDPNSFGINKYAGRLQANNTSDTGWAIVPASEIGGHRRVATLDDLKNLTVPILSENTTGNDAVGQLWYVDSEACFYQLISWTNRKSIENGWKKFTAGSAQRVLPIDGVVDSNYTLAGLAKADGVAEDVVFTFALSDDETVNAGKIDRSKFGVYFYQKVNTLNDKGEESSTANPAYAYLPSGCFVLADKVKGTDAVAGTHYAEDATPKPEADATSTPAPDGSAAPITWENAKSNYFFTEFYNSDLYAYNDEVEQIFIDPAGQAWKYNEDGTQLVHADFVSAFATVHDLKKLEDTVGDVDKKIDDRIAGLVDGAPEDMDTLKELSAAIKTFEGEGGKLEAFVPKTREIIAGDGLTGGGDLSADVTIGIDDSGVTTAKIAASAVTDAKIASNAVTTAKIADANVTTAKIADSGVTDTKIASNAVTTAKIADANVTTAKIADANVTTAKIADSGVTTAKIADSGVTTAKLASDSVSLSKVAGDARSMFAVNALKFYCVATNEDVVGLVEDTTRQTSKISNFDIIFSPHKGNFVYAHKVYANDDTTKGPESAALDSSTEPDTVGQKYYPNFTFGDVSSEMYMYEAGVEKRYVDANGDYWVWASNGKNLVKATETVTSDDLDTLTSDVNTLTNNFESLNSMVTGDSRNLVSPTISATFTVYTNGVAGTPQTISSNPGAIFAGQTASLTSATFKYNAGTTYRKPVSCSGDWSELPADNTNSSAISITDITVSNCTSDAKKLSVTLSAPKVGLMVSGTKVVPASGNDTTSKSIAVSYKYRIFSGAFTKDPASLTADDIKALTVGEGTSKGKTFTINVDNSTRYAYAYPKSWGAPSISKGVEDQSKFWSNKTISITTSEGWTADYYVYYTTGPGAYSGDSIKFA